MTGSDKNDSAKTRVGLALAGGGVQGAVYEIGAICALDEALEGVSFHEVDAYVGVSAGAIVGAMLANGITPHQLWRSVSERDSDAFPMGREVFFTPAVKEFIRRASTTPRLALEALWDYARNPGDQTLLGSLARLSRALPVGFFDNEPIRALLHKTFSYPGRTDDFRELQRKLFVVCADIDSGEPVCFGKPGWDHVPISRAVQASAALPVLYSAVEIDGRHYVDGVLLKTLHASVSLEEGVKLLFCLNPIVPVDTTDAIEAGVMRRGKLIHRGLPTVLSQTFRTMVHSRLTVGLASYAPRFPGQDVILIEPGRDDYRMFFTNIFKLSDRRVILEHAYRSTRRQLLERKDELQPILERHGVQLRLDVLEDPEREFTTVRPSPQAKPGVVAGRLGHALDRLESILDQGPG